MSTWLIIIIIICGFIYFLVLWNEYSDYKHAKKKGLRLHWFWQDIVNIVFAPLVVLWRLIEFPIDLIKEYRTNLKKHGGYRGYKEWKKEEKKKEQERKKEWQAEKAEYDRITAAYKRKELRRDELPRSLDGIRKFEFYGNLLCDDWRELVYIENEYNEVLNDFFKRHPKIELKHDIRVIYLPQCLQELTDNAILRYWNPGKTNEQIDYSSIDTSTLLNEVCYPEDISKLSHGIVSCIGWSDNHGAEYLYATYFPLEEADDDNILKQIEAIAKDVFGRNTGGVYCTVERPSKDKKPTKDFADEQFGWEINTMIDEIRERVEKLEQRGVSRNILMKLLSKEIKLSHLVITKDLRIMLPDYNMEIEMEPINKAVYLLFLKHPEGIVFKTLPDYRKELAEIYQKIKPFGLNDRTLQSIEDVTNPLLNSINEKCARIRGAFIAKFDDSLAQHYYIYGRRGEAKKVALPRDLVIWE